MKTKIFTLIICILSIGVMAQNVGISDDGNSFDPNASALLELKSTSKGILIPRLTYSQRIAITEPAEGLMVYQTDDGASGPGFYYNSSSTVVANWVYVCNSDITYRQNHVLVKSLSDLPTPSGSVITLADNTTYEINGSINVGGNTISVGSNCAIVGNNKFTDHIIYTGTGSLFSISNKSCIFKSISVISASTGSKVFNSSGTNNLIQVFDIMFNNCKNIGEFNGGFAVNINNCAVQGIAQGVTFKGNLSHVFYNNNKHCSNTGDIVIIPSGTFTSIQVQNNYFEIASGDNGLNISADQITLQDAKIVNNFFHGDGEYVSGVSVDYAEWFFFGNTELEDTEPSGLIIFDSNTVTTNIAAKNTYYKVAGTNYNSTTTQFDTNSTNNRLRYLGTKRISGNVSLTGSILPDHANKHIYIAIVKNGIWIMAYKKVKPSSTSTPYDFSFNGKSPLDTNDYLEVWVKTQGSAFDVKMVDMQFKVDK